MGQRKNSVELCHWNRGAQTIYETVSLLPPLRFAGNNASQGRPVMQPGVVDGVNARPSQICAGTSLELEERPEGLVLRPIGQCPSTVQKNGVWVHLGKAPQGFDWSRIVDDARDERTKDTAGL